MDRSNLHDLFSRGSTPPISQSQHQLFGPPPSHIESLFHGLNAPSDQQSTASGNTYASSEPATPSMSQSDDPITSSNVSTAESALLSLLGSVSSVGTTATSGPGSTVTGAQAQVLATLPGAPRGSGASPPNNNESQGKILLEQLMSG
jgi:hypothetical protein